MKKMLFLLLCVLLLMIAASCAVVPSAAEPSTEPENSPMPTVLHTEPSAKPITPEPSELLPTVKKGGVVLIYNGEVAAEGCPEALAVVAESMGMDVEYFDSAEQLPDLLQETSMCMIGGTEDDLNPLIDEFTPQIRKKLKDWIDAGGGYLGICGGAYIGSKGWEEDDGFINMLGLVPFVSEEYLGDPDPRIITVDWNGEERAIYYAYGPAFVADSAPGTEVIARYTDGRVAVLASEVGKGCVVLSGPHPEADETWLDDDPEPINAEEWESTQDLIEELFQRLR